MRKIATALGAISIYAGSAFLAGATASQPSAHGTNPIETRDYLLRFHNDPKSVMNTPLAKMDPNGNIIDEPTSPLELSGANTDELLQARDAVRARMCAAGGRTCDLDAWKKSRYSGINEENQITKFLYEPGFLTKLSEMEGQNLLEASVPKAPWSDSFWPMNKGLAGRRWMDSKFPESSTWIDNYNYYLAVPPTSVGVNSMAPTEKYDYLVGDGSFRLTNANWAAGKDSWDKRGMVPGWAGLCHGWAPAAFMTPTPKKSVTVTAANGGSITFYPSDIKALSSLAWGEAPPRVLFVGTRCKTNKPKEDAMGRVIDEGCFDVNPGTWHMGIVNQIGKVKRSFVFDATYDFQVWNYPIYAYHYEYFNPQTLETSTNLGGASIRVNDYTIDKFKTYRNPNARYIVGIAMTVHYVVPTAPSMKPVLTPRFESKKYVYDLELDANGVIIGGEWYSNFHPDFIWNPPPDGKTISEGETELSGPVSWDGRSQISEELRKAARISSKRQQPLSVIVDTLNRLAQEGE